MVNAQEYLNKNYPKEIRSSVKDLYLREKQLEGHLNLQDFTNLERLDCCFNQLTSLDLTGLEHLRVLYANDNLLTDLDYSKLNPEKLISLVIDNNNLAERDIAVFSQFINLEDLRIGSDNQEKINQGIYNRFFGSLASLQNLTRLEDVIISSTDINSGVNFLPVGVRKIRYSTIRPESKLREITQELDNFFNREINENWQSIHSDFTERKEEGWKVNCFNYQETKKWIKVGLQPDDWNLAAYLRARGYSSNSELNLVELKKENRSFQKYLEEKYPPEKRKWVNWLYIIRSGLEGDLTLKNWPNLEKIDCYHNQLTSLTINNCPKFTRVECSNNKIAKLTIIDCPEISILNVGNNRLSDHYFLTNLNPEKLIALYITNNNFPPQDIAIFSKFVNLKYFYLANNRFYGNLQSLQNLTRLEKLGISGTDVSDDWEYLPNDLRDFDLPISFRERELVKATWKIRSTKINVTYHDLLILKEAQPAFQKLKESWEKLHPSQNIWDFLKRENIFFNVKLGNFQANDGILISFLQKDQIISEKEKEIIKLRKVVAEISGLREAIDEKKKIIINKVQFAYPNEKGLLDSLIQSYTELERAKGKKIFDSDEMDELEEKYEETFNKLKNKPEKKFIQEIVDREGLVTLELELESKQEKAIQKPSYYAWLQDTKGFTLDSLLSGENDYQRKFQYQIEQFSSKQSKIKPDLRKLIGRGGYGKVYYGRWKLQDVAVKSLYLSLNDVSQKDLENIRKEINILKNLRNRHIIQYYGTYSDDQEILIIMEYAENGTLTKFINNKNKDEEYNWELNNELIRQMTLGLAYIHHQNIIHRDLKSMNILLTNNYEVKISDFGLSKTKIISSSQSKNNIVGTIRWMAPELLKGEKYSEQSDIYALGMIIWEIVAKCTTPFKDVDNNLVGFLIISGRKEEIPNNNPENICYVIEQCWKDIPEERISLEKVLEIMENDRKSLLTSAKNSFETQNSNERTGESSYESQQIGLQIPNLDEENQEQQSQIQISPK